MRKLSYRAEPEQQLVYRDITGGLHKAQVDCVRCNIEYIARSLKLKDNEAQLVAETLLGVVMGGFRQTIEDLERQRRYWEAQLAKEAKERADHQAWVGRPLRSRL